MTNKKMIGSLLLVGILTLSSTGAAFAASNSSTGTTKATQSTVTQQSCEKSNQGGKLNGMGSRFMSTDQLKAAITELSATEQAKILALQETLTAAMEKEQAAKAALNTALSSAGITVSNQGGEGHGGFGINSDTTKTQISALSASQQEAITDLQEQMQDLRKAQMTAMGITVPTKSDTTTGTGIRGPQSKRVQLTEAQLAIQKEYQTKFEALQEKLHTLLTEAGITIPTPPTAPTKTAAE